MHTYITVCLGLEDSAPTVRISAVTGIGKLYNHAKHTVQVSSLYSVQQTYVVAMHKSLKRFQTLYFLCEQFLRKRNCMIYNGVKAILIYVLPYFLLFELIF